MEMNATPTAQGKKEAQRDDKNTQNEDMSATDKTTAKEQENLLQQYSGIENLLQEEMHYLQVGLGNNLNEWLQVFKQYLSQAEQVAKWRGYKLWKSLMELPAVTAVGDGNEVLTQMLLQDEGVKKLWKGLLAEYASKVLEQQYFLDEEKSMRHHRGACQFFPNDHLS